MGESGEKKNESKRLRAAYIFNRLLLMVCATVFILLLYGALVKPRAKKPANTSLESGPAKNRLQAVFERNKKAPAISKTGPESGKFKNIKPRTKAARPGKTVGKKTGTCVPRVKIAAAGDVMLQRRCNRSAKQRSKGESNNFGYDGLFPGLSEAFIDSDISIANMEFPVFETKKRERAGVFHGTSPVLHALKKAGFTLLTTANNHSYDHGSISPASTSGECVKAGISCIGAGPNLPDAVRPYMVQIDGMELSIIGYSLINNSNFNRSRPDAPHVNGYRWSELIKQVKAAARVSDGVIVNLHWGREYRTTPLRGQPGQARELADAGACLILGHHPHVLEPVDLIKAKDGRRVLVAYSLGNFLSNQGGRSTLRIIRLGVILKVELVRTELGVEVASWDSMTTWVHNRNIRIEGKRIEDVHVEVVPLMIEKLEREIMDEQDERKKRALKKKVLFYQGRIKAAEKILKRPRGELEVSWAF